MGFLDKFKNAGKEVLKFAVEASGVEVTRNGKPLFEEERVEAPKVAPAVPSVTYEMMSDFELCELDADEWAITKFIGFEEENIEIPAVIDGKSIVAIGEEVFCGLQGIKNIKVAEGIRSIGAKAFFDCGVETILLPDSLREVGESAFEKALLKLISFPDDVAEVGKRCFFECPSLEYAKLPKNMEILRAELFHGCEELRELVFPDSPSMIEEKAVAATGLRLTEIPSSVIVLKEAALAFSFGENAKVEEIVLPPNLKIIGAEALQGISARRLVIPTSVTGIFPEAFSFADNLEEIVIENGCEATLADGALVGCSELTMLTIPKTVQKIGALFVHEDNMYLVEDVKDEYGAQVYDKMTGEKVTKVHTQKLDVNDVPENLTIYCEAGSAAMDFARNNNIPFAKAAY